MYITGAVKVYIYIGDVKEVEIIMVGVKVDILAI